MIKKDLEKIDYPAVGECVYQTSLQNGLKLYLIPKADFNESYAIISTKFGSVDTRFTMDGVEGVKEFPKQLSQNMTLTFNSKEYSGTEDIMLFLVANSKSVGGFADAAPLASVSDGYLDVMIIKKMALLTEAPDLIFKLFQGEHPKHPSIEYFQTKELSVLPTEQTAGIAIDYDGEILEEGLPVDISIVPEALNLIILRTTN